MVQRISSKAKCEVFRVRRRAPVPAQGRLVRIPRVRLTPQTGTAAPANA